MGCVFCTTEYTEFHGVFLYYSLHFVIHPILSFRAKRRISCTSTCVFIALCPRDPSRHSVPLWMTLKIKRTPCYSVVNSILFFAPQSTLISHRMDVICSFYCVILSIAKDLFTSTRQGLRCVYRSFTSFRMTRRGRIIQ